MRRGRTILPQPELGVQPAVRLDRHHRHRGALKRAVGGDGQPGEPAEEGPSELPENGYNDADVAYMTMMVPHHRQALVMADLAKERAGSPGVRRIAARIRAAQAPEIGMMTRWLEARGEDVPEPQDDTVDMADQMGMDMGMLSADDLSDLVDAEGEEFDELFLDGMIGHHQGAIDMSSQIETDGSNIQVLELATDINAGQTAEINRMRDLEDEL